MHNQATPGRLALWALAALSVLLFGVLAAWPVQIAVGIEPTPTPYPTSVGPSNSAWTENDARTHLEPAGKRGQSFKAVTPRLEAIQIGVYPGFETKGTVAVQLRIVDSRGKQLTELIARSQGVYEGWLTFRPTTPLAVTPGEKYIFYVSDITVGYRSFFQWKYTRDRYPDGEAILAGEPDPQWDFVFRINPTPIELLEVGLTPEPFKLPVRTGKPLPGTIDEFLSKCPTAAEVDAIDKDIAFRFESDPTAGPLACKASEGAKDLTVFQKSAYQTLLLMKKLQFKKPLPWTSKNLYDWFKEAIRSVRFRSDIDVAFCCEPAGTINVPTGGWRRMSDKSMTQWMDPRSAGGLTYGMLNVFAHEARHNQTGPHTCGLKDNTVSELNAWGTVYSLFKWIVYETDPAFWRTNDPQVPPNYYLEGMNGLADFIRSDQFCREATLTPGPTPTVPKP